MRMKSGFSIAAVVATLLLMVAAPCASAQTLQTITVTQIYDHSVSINLGVGVLRQFTATGNYSDGSTQYLTQQAAWTSASTATATVTPTMGLVTAVAPGTVNISATFGGITGSTSLTVVPTQLTGMAITPSTSWTLLAGKELQFSATAEYGTQP